MAFPGREERNRRGLEIGEWSDINKMKCSKAGCEVLQTKSISIGFGCFKVGIIFKTHLTSHLCRGICVGFLGIVV